MKRGGGKKILFGLIVIVFIVAIYFTFFFYYRCYDSSCFEARQEKCVKTKYISEGDEIIWKYFIKGKKDGKCQINVELIEVKKGSVDLTKLKGYSMNCFLEIGSRNSPEADLSKCEGILKEKMYEIIIKKLHSYIIENIGEVGEELKKIV